MRFAMRRQLGAVLLVSLVSGCAVAPDDPVYGKVNEVDGRVQRIERVMSNQSLLDMAQRLDTAQADVRALRGRVEELENSNEALRRQSRELYADLDKRIAALGTSGGGAGPTVFGSTPPGPGGAPAGGSAAAEQSAYNQAFDALKTSNYPVAI